MSRGIIGIDPGKDGAAVFLSKRLRVPVLIPWEDPMNWEKFANALSTDKYVCFCEQVASSSNMGVVSAFTFGGNYRAWGTALRIFNIPTVRVLPVEWQENLGVENIPYNQRKKALHDISVKEFGKHRRAYADAYLIASYGKEHYHEFFSTEKPINDRNRKRISVGF